MAYVVVQVPRLIAFLASWAMVGGAVARDEVTAGRLARWAALVGLTAALFALGTCLEGRLATGASQVLRRRLLQGAFGVDPEHVRQEGAGRLLGRIMELEPVAALATTGGLQATVAVAEVLGVGAVLLTVPVGRPLAGALLATVVGTGVLVRLNVPRLTAETELCLLHTGRLLESLAGGPGRRPTARPRCSRSAGRAPGRSSPWRPWL